jgi:hypothetical protein
MASTYTPIATTTLGSAQATVTFSSIPSTYTDLILVSSARVTGAVDSDDILVTLNSDTGTNYSATYLNGNGTSATSGRNTSTSKGYWLYVVGANAAASTFSLDIMNLNNYSNSSTYKTMISRCANNLNGAAARAGLWRSTSAITSIALNCSNSNIATGSTFTLYGIAAA